MANLDLITKLNIEYGRDSKLSKEKKFFALNESFDPGKIEKALPDVLENLGPGYINYFEFGLPAEVALLYIDVCNFSTRFSHLQGNDIAEYFHEYYNIVIPIIYKFGGEVDKIMGDGIICVFGPPYLPNDLNTNISLANKCAKEIIKVTKDGEFSSKVAFHCGTINYFQNKTGLYKEFTMIGKPLTELFRLESVSLEEQINYYSETQIREFYQRKFDSRVMSAGNVKNAEWLHSDYDLPHLNGVDYRSFHAINYNL